MAKRKLPTPKDVSNVRQVRVVLEGQLAALLVLFVNQARIPLTELPAVIVLPTHILLMLALVNVSHVLKDTQADLDPAAALLHLVTLEITSILILVVVYNVLPEQ